MSARLNVFTINRERALRSGKSRSNSAMRNTSKIALREEKKSAFSILATCHSTNARSNFPRSIGNPITPGNDSIVAEGYVHVESIVELSPRRLFEFSCAYSAKALTGLLSFDPRVLDTCVCICMSRMHVVCVCIFLSLSFSVCVCAHNDRYHRVIHCNACNENLK